MPIEYTLTDTHSEDLAPSPGSFRSKEYENIPTRELEAQAHRLKYGGPLDIFRYGLEGVARRRAKRRALRDELFYRRTNDGSKEDKAQESDLESTALSTYEVP